MTRSESIAELAAALAKAQGEMAGAKKDALNPHFKSKYADLASVWEACRSAMTKAGLAVTQWPRLAHAGDMWLVEVETTLMHSSGQWMTDALAVPVTNVDAQGVGSALTYARRYSLAAVLGVAPEDDDGNAAVGTNGQKVAAVTPTMPDGYERWLMDLEAVSSEGTDALKKAWDASGPPMRAYLTSQQPLKWDALKKRAAKVQAVPA